VRENTILIKERCEGKGGGKGKMVPYHSKTKNKIGHREKLLAGGYTRVVKLHYFCLAVFGRGKGKPGITKVGYSQNARAKGMRRGATRVSPKRTRLRAGNHVLGTRSTLLPWEGKSISFTKKKKGNGY